MTWWRYCREYLCSRSLSSLMSRRFASNTTTRQRGRKRAREPEAFSLTVHASDLALRCATTQGLIPLVETHTPLILRFLGLSRWSEVFVLGISTLPFGTCSCFGLWSLISIYCVVDRPLQQHDLQTQTHHWIHSSIFQRNIGIFFLGLTDIHAIGM